mgnify:CR=1 FL=1
MKKALFALAAILALTALSASRLAAGEKLQFGGSVVQEDQFMRLLMKGYEDACAEAGHTFLAVNSNGDQGKEAETIHTWIAQGVSGIAVAPVDMKASLTVLEEASAAGIPVALTNTATASPFIAGGFTSDDYALGAMVADYAATWIPKHFSGKVNFAVLQFKTQHPTQSGARVNGFFDTLKKKGVDFEIVADQDAWLQDRAYTIASDMLTANPDIDIFFANTDGGVIGATMAIDTEGYENKYVFGFDTGEQQCGMLLDDNNILQAIVGQDPYSQGRQAMELVIKAATGGDVSASKGMCKVVPGELLVRGDTKAINNFLTDFRAKLGK